METDIDKELKTAKVVFIVTDKYFKKSTLKIEDLTILIDGEEPIWKNEDGTTGATKKLTTETITEIKF